MEGGIPFAVKQLRFNAETEAAIEEARGIIAGEIPAKRYGSARELFNELDTEITAEWWWTRKQVTTHSDSISDRNACWFILKINTSLRTNKNGALRGVLAKDYTSVHSLWLWVFH